MQPDLANIQSSELVEMLIKSTEYYIDLCKTDQDINKRKVVQERLELITTELKNRDGYDEVFKESDLGIVAPE